MAKVLVSDSLSKEGLQVLQQAEGIELDNRPGLTEDQLVEAIPAYEGLVIRSGSKVTARVIEAAAKLRVVGRAGIGVDNVDVKAASRRGIVVMNTPTGNAVTTAEHAIGLLFAIARKIPAADATMKQGKWEKKKFEGRELSGKTLGVVGLGNIGRIVADRARGLSMNVIGYDPVVTKERAAELGIELVTIDELLRRADAISVHTPLTAETRGLINDDTVNKLKKGVLLVNAARGGIYDEAALLRGLESGQIGAAALDVFVEEPPGLTDLVKHPNVVATPHLGASTEEAQLRVAVEIAQQVVAYLQSGTISNAVNVPSIPREMAPVLGPYLALARRLGQFLAQVEALEPREICVECAGDVAKVTTAPLVNAALSGVLERFFTEQVNPVNAPVMAKDRGIEVRENKTTQKGAFTTLITVTVTGKDGNQASVAGTLAANGEPRLVRWGNYEMDAHLEGAILVTKNVDKPGVLGSIGTLIGQANVNISRLQLGRDKKAGEAASLWALDTPLPAPTLDQIQKVGYVSRVCNVIVS
jgi:D-3-phosphoglycerate dehydrogenase / 2-oxoglutarate reductase